jgi:AcrR family transcriptional regulator
MATRPLSRAERREQTRDDLIAAADRLFVEGGFHATSLHQIAAAAGYTKGAVYSNFASKEDLFFAVYERRVERDVAERERALAEADDAAEGIVAAAASVAARRGRPDADGWLAVFFEFWTHVLRHPEHRERFAAIHARAVEPYVNHMERLAAQRGVELPMDSRQLTVAVYAMTTGISLERLTQPDVVDAELAVRMQRLMIDTIANGTAVAAKGA